MNLTKEIGAKIKFYRKQNGWKIADLAQILNKSTATISKYENGQIAIDIITLYELASAFGIQPEELLYHAPLAPREISDHVPAFFRGINQLYLYYFDGRSNTLSKSILDIRTRLSSSQYEISIYMNFQDYEQYHNCETTYVGTLTHHDALSNITAYNRDSEMDIYALCIPASYLNSETKWGLGFGISSRPVMPTAAKLLLSKKIQPETADFLQNLHISREDIQLLRHYNMLTIL